MSRDTILGTFTAEADKDQTIHRAIRSATTAALAEGWMPEDAYVSFYAFDQFEREMGDRAAYSTDSNGDTSISMHTSSGRIRVTPCYALGDIEAADPQVAYLRCAEGMVKLDLRAVARWSEADTRRIVPAKENVGQPEQVFEMRSTGVTSGSASPVDRMAAALMEVIAAYKALPWPEENELFAMALAAKLPEIPYDVYTELTDLLDAVHGEHVTAARMAKAKAA